MINDAVSPAPLRGAIVAMTRNRVIGVNGQIPWHYTEDLKRFKQRTLNSAIIMGRLTWESIGSRPLPMRRNIVISTNNVSGIECYNSIQGAVEACGESDLWIIGGGQIYRQAFSYLNLLDITYVPDTVVNPDAVTFPEIDTGKWKLVTTATLENPVLENHIYHRRQ